MKKLIFLIFLISFRASAADVGPFVNSAQYGIWSLRLQDGSGNPIGSSGGALNVNIASGSITITGPIAVTQSGTWTVGRTWNLLNTTDSVNVGNFPATQVVSGTGTFLVDGSAHTQPISAASLPLPTGASTSALQTTGNTSLSSIDSKITTTANGIKVDGSAVTQPVSGTITANAGSGNFTVVQSSGSNLHVDVDSVPTTPITGTVTANQGTSPWVTSVSNFPATQAVTQSGTWTTGRTWSLLNTTDSVNVGNFPATQAVTQSGTWNINNISGTVSLPTGASTEATLAALSAKFNSLGQKTSANSAPVVLASDQSAIPVTQSGTWTNIVTQATAANLNATVVQSSGTNLHVNVDSAPTTTVTGTVTSNQGTSPWVENVSQFGGSNVVTGTGNSGAGIPRVTVSSDSNITNISGTISLPTGAATSANQTGGGQKTQVVDGANATVGPVTTLSSVNYLPVVQASSGATGSAVPARTTQIGGSDGTNLRTLSTDTSGNANVNIVSTTTAARTSVALARNVYSTTNVTTAAYVQLIASTSNTVNQLYIFDSSGQTLVISTGGAGSEVDQAYIVPGGNGILNLTIASGTRVSVKAVSATANSGELNITFLK